MLKPGSPNEEISLNFAGPFQNAENKKKYISVSVNYNTGWSDAMFLPDPTADRVIEFLKEYISKNGIPSKIQTYPGTVFESQKYNQFCKELCIEQVVCPVRHHRGNGEVERMIITIKEQLRVDKDIGLTKKGNTVIY